MSKKNDLKPMAETQSQIQVSTTTIKAHQGPLPSAEEFSRYEQVLPGGAERLMAMAERQQTHSHFMEVKFLTGLLRNDTAVIWLGYGSIFTLIGSGVYLIHSGQIAIGSSAIAVGAIQPIVTVIVAILEGLKNRKK